MGPRYNVTVQYPDLSNLITQCISAWSYAELDLAVLLSVLLGADASPTAAAFTVLRRFSNSSQVMLAAAAVTLNASDMKLLSALLAVTRTAQQRAR